MDRWREFFGSAGEDLWAIIEQAIILAATDFPQEFRSKRCDIAETLFARRPAPSVNHGEVDATRLSGSVITNSTIHMGTPLDTDEIRGGDHATEHVLLPSGHPDHDEANPLRDGLEGDDLITAEVDNIKEILATSEQTEMVLLDALQRLESLQITVIVLRATEIGKQVNHLRKHASKRVRLLAKGLVRHWKELVDEWASNAQGGSAVALGASGTCETPPTGGNNGVGPSPIPLDERGVSLMRLAPTEAAERLCHTSNQTARLQARNEELELPEERGSSSRAELGLGVSKMIHENSKACRPRPGRTLYDGSDTGHGNILNGTAGKFSNEAATRCNERDTDRNSGAVRIPPISKPVHADETRLADKFEASKRKLQEGYAQAENAKRQRVAQVISLHDLPEEGAGRMKGASLNQQTQTNRWNQSRR